MKLPRSVGALSLLGAWLTPWRPAFRVTAHDSNLAFYVHRKDVIGRHIAKYGAHEPALTRWIGARLAASPPGLFVDVGANIGWHTLHAARHDTVEAVVAFEPDAFNAWLLDRNLSHNRIDKVIVNPCALGARSGTARLHRYKPSNLGRHSITADHGYGSRTVPVLDLDTALDNLGFGARRIAILKIDVEGYEPAVIEGASRSLARTDVVIHEHSPDLARVDGRSANDAIDRLQNGGFAPFALRDDGGLTPWDAERLRAFAGQTDLIWMRSP